MHATSGPQPESERVRGALGSFSEGRMFVEVDPVWRAFITTGPVRVSGPLSPRAQSPRQA